MPRCPRHHLTGLPPAFLDVGSAECLRDEILVYASPIWQAGGRAELHVWPGGIHAFDREVPEADQQGRRRGAAQLMERLLAID